MTLSVETALQDVGLAYPGTGDRLVGAVHAGGLSSYRAAGGYAPIGDVDAFLSAVEASGLRGRGGASFPAAIKLRAVRSSGRATVVVANGEEGEPASVKDRWLMRTRPHLVLDGLRLAAEAVGSEQAYVYLSDPVSQTAMEQALAELAADPSFHVSVHVVKVEPTYVAGEETAAVRAINGGPALPADKPPRPFEEGVGRLPTLVNNVETLANLALLHRIGVDAYRDAGTESSAGAFLLTLTTPGRSGLYEVPFGATLREVLAWIGEEPSAATGFLVGGYFAGLLGTHALDLPLDYDAYAAAGSGLGCGAVVVLDESTCPVIAASAVMTYFGRENAGQCGSCFNGTAAMAAVLEALRDQRATAADLDRLRHWTGFLPGRGACRTLDGAAGVAASLLREFPELVSAHEAGRCEICVTAALPSYPPYAVSLVTSEA